MTNKTNEALGVKAKHLIESMQNTLLFKSANLTYVGELDGNNKINTMDHLTCFVPGTLLLANYNLGIDLL